MDKIIREKYLKDCLKEYAEMKDSYSTREGYLEARRKEISIHKEIWREEDNKN